MSHKNEHSRYANTRETPNVFMFVFNNSKHDARVLKEAKTLADAGYNVTIVAILDKNTEPYEERDGFSITRVKLDPVHIRLLRSYREGRDVLYYTKAALLYPIQILVSAIRWLRPKAGRVGQTILLFGQKIFDLSKQAFVLALKIVASPIVIAAKIFGAANPPRKKRVTRTWYLRVGRPLKIFWYRHVKRAWNLWVRRPLKLAGSKIHKQTYAFLKSVLMRFHRPLSYLDYYQRAAKVIPDGEVDIFHGHDLNALPAAFLARRKNTSARVIYDSHELYVERNTQRKKGFWYKFLTSQLEKYLIRRSSAVITVNNAIAEELARRYKINKPVVIRNVPYKLKVNIDDSAERAGYDLKTILGIANDTPLLLYLGGITFNRGIEELIESLVHLDDCRLAVVGYGPDKYKKELSDLATELGVNDRLFFYGPVEHRLVPLFAASADLGVAPIKNCCLSYYLSLPNKLFEYIAAGLPVIGSNLPEIRGVIEEYKIGAVFDPEDPADIAEAAKSILSDKSAYQRMRSNAHKAAEVLNWENESKKLVELYSRMSG